MLSTCMRPSTNKLVPRWLGLLRALRGPTIAVQRTCARSRGLKSQPRGESRLARGGGAEDRSPI